MPSLPTDRDCPATLSNREGLYRAWATLRGVEEKVWITLTWGTEQAQGDEVFKWMRDLWQTRKQIDPLVDTCSRHVEEDKGEHH